MQLLLYLEAAMQNSFSNISSMLDMSQILFCVADKQQVYLNLLSMLGIGPYQVSFHKMEMSTIGNICFGNFTMF